MGIIPQKLIDKGRWWTKAWSLVEGCSPVSESCSNCWLKAMHKRFKPDAPFEHVHIREDRLDIPLKTRKPQVFAIWSDLFHEQVENPFIDKVIAIIEVAQQHTFLVLTKRPIRAKNYFLDRGYISAPNLWVGVTCETQEQANKRIPELLKIPGKKFLSVEPMLQAINIRRYLTKEYLRLLSPNHEYIEIPVINQVICGSESGIKRRATKIEWVENLVMQCDRAGVPIFIKQLSINEMVSKDMSEWPINLRRRDLVWGI